MNLSRLEAVNRGPWKTHDSNAMIIAACTHVTPTNAHVQVEFGLYIFAVAVTATARAA